MLVESFYATLYGWKSAGMHEASPAEILEFIQENNNSEPRLVVQAVRRHGQLTEFTRAIRVSGSEVERNECLFNTEAEAGVFADALARLAIPDIHEGSNASDPA